MKRYVARPVMASTITSEVNRLYDFIFNTFIRPTATRTEDGTYTFCDDSGYGCRGFDPFEAKRIIRYALAGSKVDRPSDDEIIDEVLDNAIWKIEDGEDY